MGRTTGWLAERRQEMVEVLREMERGSAYTNGNPSGGDLGLMLARLAKVITDRNGRVRTVSAMRQAWWRWTSDRAQAATPPVQELALVVHHAKTHGWLKNLKRPACLALVDRLMLELDQSRAKARRELEAAWNPTAREAVSDLVDFFEAQIARRADKEGELAEVQQRQLYWGACNPPAFVVQEEFETMVKETLKHCLLVLKAPRGMFETPLDTDSFYEPHEGWPTMLRELAASLSEAIHRCANDLDDLESSLLPTTPEGSIPPKRKKIFRDSADEVGEPEPLLDQDV